MIEWGNFEDQPLRWLDSPWLGKLDSRLFLIRDGEVRFPHAAFRVGYLERQFISAWGYVTTAPISFDSSLTALISRDGVRFHGSLKASLRAKIGEKFLRQIVQENETLERSIAFSLNDAVAVVVRDVDYSSLRVRQGTAPNMLAEALSKALDRDSPYLLVSHAISFEADDPAVDGALDAEREVPIIHQAEAVIRDIAMAKAAAAQAAERANLLFELELDGLRTQSELERKRAEALQEDEARRRAIELELWARVEEVRQIPNWWDRLSAEQRAVLEEARIRWDRGAALSEGKVRMIEALFSKAVVPETLNVNMRRSESEKTSEPDTE